MHSLRLFFTTLLVVINLTISANAAPMIVWDILDDGNGNGSNPGGSQPTGQNDTAGNFAAAATSGGFFIEPLPVSENSSNFTSISATEVNSGIQMIISEGTYNSANLGVAPTISDITGVALPGIHSSSNLDYESSIASGSNGTGQNSASSSAWGVDTDGIINASSNTVLLFDLTMGADANFFGLDILDMEGGNAPSSYIGVYDSTGLLISSIASDWPSPEFGDNAEVFFGISDTNPLSYIAFFVGDDNGTNNGYNERIAAADFYAGELPTGVPAPDRATLLVLAIIALVTRQRFRLQKININNLNF